MSESQYITEVDVLFLRYGKASGPGGLVTSSASMVPIFSIWPYRNGTVRSRTTRWRGAHSRSVSSTCVNATGRWRAPWRRALVSGCVGCMALFGDTGGRAARPADHQAAGQAFDPGRSRSVHHVEQAKTGLAAEFVQVHVDGGDGRPRRGGDDVPVVETHHGNVVGHAHARVAQAVDDAARDLVAAAEDGV